jgi:dTDP-4-dehydrorhamnose 3,5-epimerase
LVKNQIRPENIPQREIMIFTETKLKGAFIVEVEKRGDARGFFARAWCKEEFAANGLNTNLVQSNIAFSKKAGTLRGLHYQAKPYEEVKLVRCTRGAVYDVIVDLRLESPMYMGWVGVELTAGNYKMLYVPENFAHGYQTLTDHAEVTYHVSQVYSPASERGIRWNDPAIKIEWPKVDMRIISEKDQCWPDCSL